MRHFYWEGDDLVIKLLLEPNFSRSKVVGIHGDYLKITLMTLPIDGQANKELIKLLCNVFKVKKADISTLAGERSRNKTVRVCAPAHLPSVFFE